MNVTNLVPNAVPVRAKLLRETRLEGLSRSISVGEVVLKGVRKSYGATHVLKNIDLAIQNGEFVVFVGPSGCGKSTLLRMIAGLEDISEGDLLIGGTRVNDTPPAERGISMVFQSYALYPHLDLFENIAFAMRLAKEPQAQIDAAVQSAAKKLRIDHLLQRKPKDLSGGQRQRVAIGRAIVRKPAVFLFDEPLSNLDAALRVEMRYEFAKLHDELKSTMIYVTHDQVEAMTLADRIVVLSAGKIEQVGSPLELYEKPCNQFVAGFIGSPQMNFMPAKLLAQSGDGVRVSVAGTELQCAVDVGSQAAGAVLALGVRPEHLSFAAEAGANTLPARIEFVETLGSSTQAYCKVEGLEKPLSVTLDGRQRPKRGDSVQLKVSERDTYLFAADGQALTRRSTSGAL
jgi:multiple sugar transport system ATP-binding protein